MLKLMRLVLLPLAIQTAAMDMLGGEGIEVQCRKADIMADAAYAVFSRPLAGAAHTTGHFLIDEDILRGAGLSDMDVYAVKPGQYEHPSLVRHIDAFLLIY